MSITRSAGNATTCAESASRQDQQPAISPAPVNATSPSPLHHGPQNNGPASSATPNIGLTALHERYPTTDSMWAAQHQMAQPTYPAGLGNASDLNGFGEDLDRLWENAGLDMPWGQYPMHFSPFNADISHDFFAFPEDITEGLGNALYRSTSQVQGDSIDVEPGPLSRYGSRLPSLQPEEHQLHGRNQVPHEHTRPSVNLAERIEVGMSPWRLTRFQYDEIIVTIRRYSSVLPEDMSLPSRHALIRYLEGYFSGFHEHLPFLHVPTLSMEAMQPELVLAIAATGAVYRFEPDQSEPLYAAAQSLVQQKLREWDKSSIDRTAFPKSSPWSAAEPETHSFPRGPQPDVNVETDSQPSGMGAVEDNSRIFQTMQAMILLIALGTWSRRPLLKDAFAMSSQLAVLVREVDLSEESTRREEITWHEWARNEGQRRTALVAYCFFGLHSIAFNAPPKILSSEIKDHLLPCHEKQWKATNEEDWNLLRSRDPFQVTTLHAACSELFNPNGHSPRLGRHLSSFANYILAHAILQQIFFSRQSLSDFEQSASSSLPEETIRKFERALRRWQHNWESTKDSSLDPSSPYGPLAFNATALLRIAYIRLHANLGPCRQLETGDATRIARAMNVVPPIARSPQVCRAVLQTAHTLSIPVRIGVRFVAKTRTLAWSVVHSLYNLECAMLLSQWLNYMGEQIAQGLPLDDNEQRLASLVQSLLDEAFVGHHIRQEPDPARKCKKMAAATARLWADTFQGAHIFGLFAVIAEGLRQYADALDQGLAARPP
ncbi:hypothetical protein LTR17_002159 [Elasticomyces elasticus]|nr:hypothetical protein LTR17_002159 [Elasticomyces elasticus]